jgi:mannose-6-phosphate isomerase-like protein (cupin superfamily)
MTTKKVIKGWGHELIWANHENYCGKILSFDREGAECSMHFHKVKDETWIVQQGRFLVIWCDTDDACYHEKILNTGDVWHNPPMVPHKLRALESNSRIIEVSTYDDPADNYRIQPGDSQSSNHS